MAAATGFDLASLTKVVATLPSVLTLVDAGEIALDDQVGAALPAFGTAGWKGEVTIRRLLSHSAGLAAWLPLYLDHAGPAAYLAAIAAAEPAARPGERVIYSDLGFILLGELVRRIDGRDIAAFARDELFARLGLADTLFTPPATRRERIAATERGNETEVGMCGERAAAFPRWRREVIWGEANDGNSFYGLGGVAGHAGLFGTAQDLARYGRLWLQGGAWDGRQLLSEALVAEATREQAPGRGLGWRLPAAGDRPSGAPADPGIALGPGAYGHTGFTGTSLWLDPGRDLVVVLLTNRLHPTARPEIESIRPAFHAALAAALPVRPASGGA
jgi:CubicO group peptidase (beta-lactamase class C family)